MNSSWPPKISADAKRMDVRSEATLRDGSQTECDPVIYKILDATPRLVVGRPAFGGTAHAGEGLCSREVRERKRRSRPAPDNRRGFVDELVVVDCRHHELGEVHATRDVAVQNGVPYVPAPYRQALALPLLEVATAHDGPPRIAGKHTPAGLHLVVEIGEASETGKRAERF